MTRSRLVAFGAAIVVALATVGVVAAARSGTGDFVTRSGAGFELDGKPFRFVGFNLYDGAASDLYSCSPGTRLSDAKLAAAMRYLHDDAGASVVRFWAYQPYTDGGTDFSGVDRIIHAAQKAGLRVIPVLEDGPGQCSTGPPDVAKSAADEGNWYTEGYKQRYGDAALSYRDYVRKVTRHYRNNSTIMAWMMMNEAETEARTPSDQTVLRDFAADIGSVIRAADAHHLITLGTQGNGAPGTSGRDFAAVYSLPVLDFAEVHDWATHGNDADPMPGATGGVLPAAGSSQCQSTSAPIACSFAIARQLGKPLLVGEAGIAATDAATRSRRAGQLKAKLQAAFAAGADGYLVWQLNTSNTDGYAVVLGTADPLTAVLAREAKMLS